MPLFPGRFTSTNDGLVPLSGGSTGTKYLADTGVFTTPAGGGGGYATPTQMFIANNFYWLGLGGQLNSVVGSSTVTRYMPFFVPYTITISQLGARVGTTSAGGNFTIGIYANGANNQPTGAILGNTGNLSTTTSAVVVGALGANLQLAAGWYWTAFQVDNATATFNSFAVSNTIFGFFVGVGTAANLTNSAGNAGTQWTGTTTFGTFGTGPTITEGSVSTANFPCVMIKIASVP